MIEFSCKNMSLFLSVISGALGVCLIFLKRKNVKLETNLTKNRIELEEKKKELINVSIELDKNRKHLTRAQIELEEKKKINSDLSYEDYHALTEKIDRKASLFFRYAITNPVSNKNNFNYFNENYSFNSISNIDSLFKLRTIHFHEEKVAICKQFIKNLCSNKLFKSSKKIYLCLDSGSTIFPIFSLLCKYYWDSSYHDILNKVIVITNNLPGVAVLCSKGRKGVSLNAEMIYKCYVIPGIADGKYNATLDDEGAKYLFSKIYDIKQNESDITIISAITGNYISIEDGLLWRGDCHGKLKNAMIASSDYVFILSPLGKIFNYTCGHINKEIMRYGGDRLVSKEYHDLRSEEAQFLEGDCSSNLQGCAIMRFLPAPLCVEDNIFLLTTTREDKKNEIYPRGLHGYFSSIQARLKSIFNDKLITIPFAPSIESDQVISELQLYKQQDEAFRNYEFPHKVVRDYMREAGY